MNVSAEHEASHGDVDHGLCDVNPLFVVLHEERPADPRLRQQDHLDVSTRDERGRDPRPSTCNLWPGSVAGPNQRHHRRRAGDVTGRQNQSLETVYPVVFFDAFRVKTRDESVVRNKAVPIALGVPVDGTKQVIDLWIEQNERDKF